MEKVVELEPDADYLTKRFTERAVDFIKRNKEEPFFLYLPHPIPHRPLHASPPFMEDAPDAIKTKLKNEKGIDYKTRDKLYKQAIAEIDWSVGQILDTLIESGIDERTFVIFTSDNGPRLGSAKPLRGGKGSTLEGGMRVPTVVRWPENIPRGVVNDEIMTTMDLLPTFAKLAGGDVPVDRAIDGKDIWQTLIGKAKTPHEAFYYYKSNSLDAVRSGDWKLHLKKGKPVRLYNLKNDIGEAKNLLGEHPEIVKRLSGYRTEFAKDIATNNRTAGQSDNPKPLTK